MATINPTNTNIRADGGEVPMLNWLAIAAGDTVVSKAMPGRAAVAGAVQIGGTFGGATVKLQMSNDDTTYFDMKDLMGNTIQATAAGIFEFTTAAAYIKPVSTGGTAGAVNVVVSLRG